MTKKKVVKPVMNKEDLLCYDCMCSVKQHDDYGCKNCACELTSTDYFDVKNRDETLMQMTRSIDLLRQDLQKMVSVRDRIKNSAEKITVIKGDDFYAE